MLKKRRETGTIVKSRWKVGRKIKRGRKMGEKMVIRGRKTGEDREK